MFTPVLGKGLALPLSSKLSSFLEMLTVACALPGKGVAWRTDSGRDSFLKGGVVDYQRREGKRLNLAVIDLGQATNHCAGLMHVLILGSSDRLAGRHQNRSRGSHTPSIQLRTVESSYIVHCQNLKISTLAILKFIRSELLGGFYQCGDAFISFFLLGVSLPNYATFCYGCAAQFLST